MDSDSYCMLVADYDYDLPPELIAQQPPAKRGDSRMLVLHRRSGTIAFKMFRESLDYMQSGDCLVVNDTRVLPARLFGRKEKGGGSVEALVLEEVQPGIWRALLRPGGRLKEGTKVLLTGNPSHSFCVRQRDVEGTFLIEFSSTEVRKILGQLGHIPLPPYIQRKAEDADSARYQTLFARHQGAVAAPTAGLHFNDVILKKIKAKGVHVASITLHIGLGTFKPISADTIEEHRMHSESFVITEESARMINVAKSKGNKIIAVGTSVVRTLESSINDQGRVQSGKGKTSLFLYPPQQPRIVDRLLTNFHLPKSTLLLLVSTFTPWQSLLNAYQRAIRERFRFYSYGDCMFLID